MASISGMPGMSGMGMQKPMMNVNQALAGADNMIALVSQGGVGALTGMMKQQALAGAGLGGLAGGAFGSPMGGLGGAANFGAGFGMGASPMMGAPAMQGPPPMGQPAPISNRSSVGAPKAKKNDGDSSIKKLLPLLIKLLEGKGGKKAKGKSNSNLQGLLNKLKK